MSNPDVPSLVDPLEGTPYRSTRCIGAGAWAQVIEAEHRGLGKRVVVKLIHAEVATLSEAEDRFRLEAQTLANLDRHPNIVQVFDCGRTPSRRPYLVMEHLEGATLRAEMAACGPFTAADAVDLADQVLCGLEAVHKAGLVHRDIKPSNLFLCNADADGRRVLKILDFGIVKLLSRATATRRPAPLARPTTEGMIVGTPQYLAPEQALGLRVDPRTDLYSVGAVLYWMLVGKAPFHGQGEAGAILDAHVNVAPSSPSARASQPVPPSLESAILKALSKQPEDRFTSAAEFRAALQQALMPRPHRWPTTEPLNTSAIRAAGPWRPDWTGYSGSSVTSTPRAQHWASTEPLDTSTVRAAGRQVLDDAVVVIHDEEDSPTLRCPPSMLRLAVQGEPWPGAGQGGPRAAASLERCASPRHLSVHRPVLVGALAALVVLLILGGIALLVQVALAHCAAAIVG
jgi:serine/threonine-protein kinase